MERYDLVVIGGGTAGETAARVARRKLARVALVERERLGGDCLWSGCVPTKALLASAKAARHAHDSGRFGVEVDHVRVDFGAVMTRKDGIVARIEQTELPETFRREGIGVQQALGQLFKYPGPPAGSSMPAGEGGPRERPVAGVVRG